MKEGGEKQRRRKKGKLGEEKKLGEKKEEEESHSGLKPATFYCIAHCLPPQDRSARTIYPLQISILMT